ncbi:hypothetical protein WG904_10495 [Pedobacter sp. Du54]|uniref:hypothetical protein n=1 Tax=Pedobacter anseongensis TaxID=3133439 RepID=UPI0030A9A8B9
MKDKTLVLITSALFIGPKGEILTAPAAHRLKRLHKTISAVTQLGFDHIRVLDNTIPATFKLDFVKIATLSTSPISFADNEFELNGPSRLETVLLGQSLAYLKPLLVKFTHILKLSAGYEVKNLQPILAKAQNGVVFRMGNPFRTKIKFCLTSFYILPVTHFANMCDFFLDNLADMSNTKPLEYYLYCFVQQVPHRFIKVPYPRLDADFLSSGRSTADFDYRLKESVFKFIAKFGFYAYQFKG